MELQLARPRGQNAAQDYDGELKKKSGVWFWQEQIWCKTLEDLRTSEIEDMKYRELPITATIGNSNRSLSVWGGSHSSQQGRAFTSTDYLGKMS